MSMSQPPLFIFEMANNHQGSVAHGKKIIEAMRKVSAPYTPRFRFAVKFQYRDIDTFIHPDVRGRADIKNVKRFEDTRLSREDFAELIACVRANDMLTICTPFDEISAARIKEEKFDYIKIASCSFGDWPLMEAVAATRLPVIASAAGSDMETIKNVISFFSHRGIALALMHCVGEYPTPNERLQLNQLDYYRQEFPDLTLGFSTHEAPDNMEPVKIAVAKGARIFEKHVGVPTDAVTLNGYSANPQQVGAWLEAAKASFDICGVSGMRYQPSEKEAADLAALRRGVFARPDVMPAAAALTPDNVFFAFPCKPGQLIAQDFSKYTTFTLNKELKKNAAIMKADVTANEELHSMVVRYVAAIVSILKASNAVVPVGSTCDISHHYGLRNFEKTGLALIDCVNREYCKKLLVLLPGQNHPTHYHVKKEETFIVLHGDLVVTCGDEQKVLHRGETMTVERNVPHCFSSTMGCVFEEISSTHCSDDSFYERKDDFVHPRKTTVYLTKDVLG